MLNVMLLTFSLFIELYLIIIFLKIIIIFIYFSISLSSMYAGFAGESVHLGAGYSHFIRWGWVLALKIFKFFWVCSRSVFVFAVWNVSAWCPDGWIHLRGQYALMTVYFKGLDLSYKLPVSIFFLFNVICTWIVCRVKGCTNNYTYKM